MTTHTTYTPGPWKVNDLTSDETYLIVTDNVIVAESTVLNNQANARLIAAAPDLLTAGQYALRILGALDRGPMENRAVEQLQDAIARAEGRD